MTKKLCRIALPMVLAMAGASGMVSAAEAAKPVTCDIRVTSSGDSVDLEALLSAQKAVSGSYEFEVSSSSSAGTSSTNQGDDFSAGAGETSLGTVSINGSYKATLTVKYAGGSISCTKNG